MKTNNRINTLTTAIGAMAWISFAIYFYCSSKEVYFQNHSSLYFQIGSKAIILSAISAGLSSILSTYLLIKDKKSKHNYINIGISYSITAFFIFMYWLATITGGA